MDRHDAIILLGIMLVVAAAYLSVGLWLSLGLAGIVLIAVGIVGARNKAAAHE